MMKLGVGMAMAAGVVAFTAPVEFRAQEIANGLGVIYAVTVADVNGDRRPDIVAINNKQVLWFENPSWTRHKVVERSAENDNVAIAPLDIDADGKLDFAFAADWQPTNTTSGGTLHWVTQDGRVCDIGSEPTLHRIGWVNIDGEGLPELIAVPLHGRGAKAPDWRAEEGARILAYRIPKDPARDVWRPELVDDSLHIVHNFIGVGSQIWVAAAEGVYAFERDTGGRWSKRLIGEGAPGEIKLGRVNGKRNVATVEPWHGNSIVLYEETGVRWNRSTIESNANQAHALGWGDFDRDASDELVAGWRGKPWGLARYSMVSGTWSRTMIDDGVAVEDLAVHDLNLDGRPEIVAGGRATGNIRIYWASE